MLVAVVAVVAAAKEAAAKAAKVAAAKAEANKAAEEIFHLMTQLHGRVSLVIHLDQRLHQNKLKML